MPRDRLRYNTYMRERYQRIKDNPEFKKKEKERWQRYVASGATTKINQKRRKEWEDFLGPIACEICGYNKCKRALSFHHKDPETKLFEVGASHFHLKKKITREQFIAEMNKCVCLCMNCHMEIEDTA